MLTMMVLTAIISSQGLVSSASCHASDGKCIARIRMRSFVGSHHCLALKNEVIPLCPGFCFFAGGCLAFVATAGAGITDLWVCLLCRRFLLVAAPSVAGGIAAVVTGLSALVLALAQAGAAATTTAAAFDRAAAANMSWIRLCRLYGIACMLRLSAQGLPSSSGFGSDASERSNETATWSLNSGGV